jgi:hypothetical protein
MEKEAEVTLLPAPEKDIEVAEGEAYEKQDFCANPKCQRMGIHSHHIVRRSYTAGPVDWVKIGGVKVGNVVELCVWCHDKVTRNKIPILWVDTEMIRGFTWEGFLLDPHPPTDGWTPSQILSPQLIAHEHPCKRCHGTGTEPVKEEPEWTEEVEEKPKSVYAVRIPKSELGWGHKQLTEWIRLAGRNLHDLGYDEKTPPYHILSAVLFDWNEGRENDTIGADSASDL